jgi:hypothetical protein
MVQAPKVAPRPTGGEQVFDRVVPLSRERHGAKRVRSAVGFGYAAGFHIAYVTMHEFARAEALYPVLFLQDGAPGRYRPVVLMGLEAGENLYVGDDGRWAASYIPAMIRRYPFALSRGDRDGRYVVCVDEGSDLLSETEGAPLFDDEGRPTELIENVKRYLTELQQMDHATKEFVDFLVARDLLTSLSMRIATGDRTRNVTGCHVINEEKLNELDDETFLELRRKRFLPAIYAHLMSMPQIERLVQMRKDKEARLAQPESTKPASSRSRHAK